jgi:hypothetical protein
VFVCVCAPWFDTVHISVSRLFGCASNKTELSSHFLF